MMRILKTQIGKMKENSSSTKNAIVFKSWRRSNREANFFSFKINGNLNTKNGANLY